MPTAWIPPLVLAVLAVGLLAATISGVRRRAFGRSVMAGAAAVALTSAALATGAVAWSLAHYQALTREVTAATVHLTPTGAQRFRARVSFPDGRDPRTFDLRGDHMYVDAQIVKWHPAANVIGLHTAYRLDRIGGRYRSLDDERAAPRTVAALAAEGSSNGLIDWIAERPWSSGLVDARYGSATFTAADEATTVDVRVSTSGLLIRPAQAD